LTNPSAPSGVEAPIGISNGRRPALRTLSAISRILGISADDEASTLQAQVQRIIGGMAGPLDVDPDLLARGTSIEVDDRFVGDGYGIESDASQEAIGLVARTEGIFLGPTYTGKAMAGLIAYVRQKRFTEEQTVLFWHTGGQVALFA